MWRNSATVLRKQKFGVIFETVGKLSEIDISSVATTLTVSGAIL